jgi:histidine triad (HIT) family protein
VRLSGRDRNQEQKSRQSETALRRQAPENHPRAMPHALWPPAVIRRLDDRQAPTDPTFYSIEPINHGLLLNIVAPSVLDVAYLSTLALQAAGDSIAIGSLSALPPIGGFAKPDGECNWEQPAMAEAYDPGNIFAKILRGEIPSHRVYEDDAVVAFMDVMPQGIGHTLVVPKAPSRNMLDADPATLGPLFGAVQKVAVAVKKAFKADGVTLMQFNEPASGQTVYHLHVHVVPRFEGVPLKPHSGQMEKPEVLAENAGKIRAALEN